MIQRVTKQFQTESRKDFYTFSITFLSEYIFNESAI